VAYPAAWAAYSGGSRPSTYLATVDDVRVTGLISDDELTAAALAADPETPVADGAVSFWDIARDETHDDNGRASALLPAWYMPAAADGRSLLRGWRRRVAIIVIAAFLAINAYGLCSTYGEVVPA